MVVGYMILVVYKLETLNCLRISLKSNQKISRNIVMYTHKTLGTNNSFKNIVHRENLTCLQTLIDRPYNLNRKKQCFLDLLRL